MRNYMKRRAIVMRACIPMRNYMKRCVIVMRAHITVCNVQIGISNRESHHYMLLTITYAMLHVFDH